MSKETLGEYLKRERELRHISLEEVAEGTKIGLHILKAMEADRWEELPGKIFIKGFTKSYAEFIGLVPEEVILRYPEEQDGKLETDRSIESVPGHYGKKVPLFNRHILNFIITIFVLLVGLGCWFFWHSDKIGHETGPIPPSIGNNSSLPSQRIIDIPQMGK
ncbi:MAG: hypothetical protein GWP10_02685 [Nitrospiraceae bacterium]|nr:hypothetical protein [Nitrospiraceae bacterium]